MFELRAASFEIAAAFAAAATGEFLGTAGAAVCADHAGFEGVDEEFEEGEAGGYDGGGDDALLAEDRDPGVVGEVGVLGG